MPLPTVARFSIDSTDLHDTGSLQHLPVVGADGTVAVQVPMQGGLPGRIAYLNVASGDKARLTDGVLAANVPLQFAQTGANIAAASFDGAIAYELPAFVTIEPVADPDQRCCDWLEGTRWSAAPAMPEAGLLRVAMPPLRHWSVIDWYRPGQVEPAWRLQLSEVPTSVVTAAVSPRAEQIVLVLANDRGHTEVRSLAPATGRTLWTTQLDQPASDDWRGNVSSMTFSSDGARLALVLEDPARCESCNAIGVFDSATGKHLHTVEVKDVLPAHRATIGLVGDTVWIFAYVSRKQGHGTTRPERCWYESHNLVTGAHRGIDEVSAEWGLSSCRIFALLPRYDREGVIGVGVSRTDISVLMSDHAP